GEGAQHERGCAGRALDHGSRQCLSVHPDTRPREADHRERRGCAHRFPGEEIHRSGQISVAAAGRDARDLRDRADRRADHGLSARRDIETGDGVMKLGLVLRTTGPTPKLDMDMVLEAERLGYDSAWTSEAWGGDAVSTVSWMLSRTTKIKGGTGIMQM